MTDSESNNETVEVSIHGWDSVPISTNIEVEPIYDENGDLDRTATLLQVNDEREHLFDELDQMDNDEILAQIGTDIEVTGAEIEQ